ncbi:virion core protein, T7 gp14 family [Microbulbifer sp. ZKSA002]|uniref:virion core protein, T7 gp14 family n=1 Tax=Microbulbifer sp. ZKSA002 TaxID=3243388 RepID=UPI00403A1C85
MAGELTSAAASTGNPYAIAAAVVADMLIANRKDKKLAKENRKRRDAAVESASLNIREMNRVFQTEQEKSVDDKLQAKLTMLRQADKVSLSAAENGVGGFSIFRLRSFVEGQGNQNVRNIDRNLDDSRARLMINKRNENRSVVDLINQLQQPKGWKQNLLDIAIAGAGSYTSDGGSGRATQWSSTSGGTSTGTSGGGTT